MSRKMASGSRTLFHQLILATITALSLLAPTVRGEVVHVTCGSYPIPAGSPYWGNLGTLLSLLTQETPYNDGYYFKTRTGGRYAPATGEASCSHDCSPDDCQKCLHQLSNDIWGICHNALSARVEYTVCWIHYDCSSNF